MQENAIKYNLIKINLKKLQLKLQQHDKIKRPNIIRGSQCVASFSSHCRLLWFGIIMKAFLLSENRIAFVLATYALGVMSSILLSTCIHALILYELGFCRLMTDPVFFDLVLNIDNWVLAVMLLWSNSRHRSILSAESEVLFFRRWQK